MVVAGLALPALFGLAIGSAVDRIGRPGSWSTRRWKRWALPIVLVAPIPATFPILVVATAVLAVWLIIRPVGAVEWLSGSTGSSFVVRALWLGIAALGLVAFGNDITAII